MSDDIQKAILALVAAGGIGFALLGGASPANVPENVGLSPVTAFVECPKSWRLTRGTEPETQKNFISCTDGTLILTQREGEKPIAFDSRMGHFLTDDEAKELLR